MKTYTRLSRLGLGALAAVAFWLVLHAQAQTATSNRPDTASFQGVVQPFLAQHCLSCHNHALQTAKLDLEAFQDKLSTAEHPEIWEKVLDKLRTGKMPPPAMQMEQHRANPSSAVCHDQIDPLGLVRENYDATGAWRTQDGNFPIDSSGTLPDGAELHGAKELKAMLAQRPRHGRIVPGYLVAALPLHLVCWSPMEDSDVTQGRTKEPAFPTRRDVVALVPAAMGTGAAWAAQTATMPIGPLSASVLPPGVRSRFVENVNGLRMHVLEAGFETPDRPALLLLHGYPELAYSWRNVMGPLAAAGFHVFAPDLRGYGRTTSAPVAYEDDLRPFGTLNKIVDMLTLVSAMGYRSIAAVIGHDHGSPLAGWCACARPDIFKAVAMMSAPFGGAPTLPFNTANGPQPAAPRADTIYDDLAKLTPPRKHYHRYYQTLEANENMWHAPQGLHAFLRAYYHMKSADWKQNHPAPLAGRTASEWAKLPRYYVMDLDKGMAEQVAAEMPSAEEIAANRWLPEADLRVYAEEYGRTGFQGGLNGYRVSPSTEDLRVFAGRTIDVPSTFMGGKSDWGVYQNPGALERLEKTVTTKYLGTHLVDAAGHWVQQEQPAALSRLLIDFLKSAS